jgi:hypothetical protein
MPLAYLIFSFLVNKRNSHGTGRAEYVKVLCVLEPELKQAQGRTKGNMLFKLR